MDAYHQPRHVPQLAPFPSASAPVSMDAYHQRPFAGSGDAPTQSPPPSHPNPHWYPGPAPPYPPHPNHPFPPQHHQWGPPPDQQPPRPPPYAYQPPHPPMQPPALGNPWPPHHAAAVQPPAPSYPPPQGQVNRDELHRKPLAIQMANGLVIRGKPFKCSWGNKPTPPGTSSKPLPSPVPSYQPVAMAGVPQGFTAAELLAYQRQLAIS